MGCFAVFFVIDLFWQGGAALRRAVRHVHACFRQAATATTSTTRLQGTILLAANLTKQAGQLEPLQRECIHLLWKSEPTARTCRSGWLPGASGATAGDGPAGVAPGAGAGGGARSAASPGPGSSR
jgi:hypothetical protein